MDWTFYAGIYFNNPDNEKRKNSNLATKLIFQIKILDFKRSSLELMLDIHHF